MPKRKALVEQADDDLENGDQDESTCQYRDRPGGDFKSPARMNRLGDESPFQFDLSPPRRRARIHADRFCGERIEIEFTKALGLDIPVIRGHRHGRDSYSGGQAPNGH